MEEGAQALHSIGLATPSDQKLAARDDKFLNDSLIAIVNPILKLPTKLSL